MTQPQIQGTNSEKPMPRWWERIRIGLFAALGLLVLGLFAAIIAGYLTVNGWEWTGVGSSTERTITTRGTEETQTVKEISAKTLWDWLQLLFVPVIIGGATYWYRQTEQDISRHAAEQRAKLEKQAALNESRKNLLYRLARSYSGAKKARRLLRAKGLFPPFPIQSDTVVKRDEYDAQMQAVNEVELELEILIEEIEASRFLFTQPDSLTKNIGSMKGYLKDLIGQYEKAFGKFEGQPPVLAIADLDSKKDKLIDFLGTAKDSNFDKYFVGSYRRALVLIQGEIAAIGLRSIVPSQFHEASGGFPDV